MTQRSAGGWAPWPPTKALSYMGGPLVLPYCNHLSFFSRFTLKGENVLQEPLFRKELASKGGGKSTVLSAVILFAVVVG